MIKHITYRPEVDLVLKLVMENMILLIHGNSKVYLNKFYDNFV